MFLLYLIYLLCKFHLSCVLEIDISFDEIFYEIMENEGSVIINIVMEGATSQEIEFTLNTRDESAVCKHQECVSQ